MTKIEQFRELMPEALQRRNGDEKEDFYCSFWQIESELGESFDNFIERLTRVLNDMRLRSL